MDSKPPRLPRIETALAVKPAPEHHNVFTNANPLWSPPGLRAVFGGAIISQALNAALHCIPPDFIIHSMNCHFINAASVGTPVFYHVDLTSKKKNFVTCIVSAKQTNNLVFTTTLSFTRDSSLAGNGLQHTIAKPDVSVDRDSPTYRSGEGTGHSIFEFKRAADSTEDKSTPASRHFRRIIQAQHSLDEPTGSKGHLIALAFLTDNWCMGTVGRSHDIPLFPAPSTNTTNKNPNPQFAKQMATLSHTIYFHNPRHACVNQWMTEEVHCPWAEHDRALVISRIWTAEGVLLVTCFQEVLIRLSRNPHAAARL